MMSLLETTAAVVISAVEDALGFDSGAVAAEATLIEDLGTEEIDLLDILFRIECATGIQIATADVADVDASTGRLHATAAMGRCTVRSLIDLVASERELASAAV
jgi:acyl carrier protein